MKLARAWELLGQLATKSATCNGKVGNVAEEVSNLKCGFDTLKHDMTVLKTAGSEVAMVRAKLQQHDKESASHLSNLLCAIEEKKERVSVLKEFIHPCGHGNWKRVEYLDFSDSETACPDVFAAGVYSERPHTCSISSSGERFICNKHTIKVSGTQYTRVCGRARAYQFGRPNAFRGYRRGRTINEAYLSGISLTHGGDLSGTVNLATHIWSFVMGLNQISKRSAR